MPCQPLGRSSLSLAAPGATQRAPEPPARSAKIAAPIVLPLMTGAPKKEVKARVERTVVMFLCDDSSSMYGASGDPGGVRYGAALSVLGLMERSGGGRAGVVHWGSEAPRSMAVEPIDIKRGRRKLHKALTIPKELGGTNLAGALKPPPG